MGWINRQALAETGETDYDLEPLRRMETPTAKFQLVEKRTSKRF